MDKSELDKISSDITDIAMGRFVQEYHRNYEKFLNDYTADTAGVKAINESLPVLVHAIVEKLVDKLS